MKVTADTNVLVRAITGDNKRQSKIAQEELAKADVVALALPAHRCEDVATEVLDGSAAPAQGGERRGEHLGDHVVGVAVVGDEGAGETPGGADVLLVQRAEGGVVAVSGAGQHGRLRHPADIVDEAHRASPPRDHPQVTPITGGDDVRRHQARQPSTSNCNPRAAPPEVGHRPS